jgi:hypothetical protein
MAPVHKLNYYVQAIDKIHAILGQAPIERIFKESKYLLEVC